MAMQHDADLAALGQALLERRRTALQNYGREQAAGIEAAGRPRPEHEDNELRDPAGGGLQTGPSYGCAAGGHDTTLPTASSPEPNNAVNTPHLSTDANLAAAMEAVASGREWGSAAVTAALRRSLEGRQGEGEDEDAAGALQELLDEARRRLERAGEVVATNTAGPGVDKSEGPQTADEPSRPRGARHYPDLGIAAKNAGLSAVYQVWLWHHYLDAQDNGHRRGVIDVATLRAAIAGDDAPYRLFGWRRLRQILAEGEAACFWTRDDHDRIWAAGEAKVKVALGVERLTGRAVYFDVDVLAAGRGEFNAHLHAATLSGRPADNPISQRKQRELHGTPERSQRRYNRLAGVEQRPNVAVGEPLTAVDAQERTWRHGETTFTFHDKKGKQGAPGRQYIGWRLPDTYEGPHRQAAKGRQRRINEATADLVQNGAHTHMLGNGRPHEVDTLFFHEAKQAVKAWERQETDVFWLAQTRRRTSLWRVLPS